MFPLRARQITKSIGETMTKEVLSKLALRSGTYHGEGVNHENQRFLGTLSLHPKFQDKGLTLDFYAKGVDGMEYHREHSLLGLNPAEKLSLWVMSSNHPGVVEHQLATATTTPGAEQTISFRCGDFSNSNTFREEILIDLWSNGDLSYRYCWGLPGGEFKERSGARMAYLKKTPIKEAKLTQTENGLVPEGDGWYVINAKESRWYKNEKFGDSCNFEGSHRFEQYGINIHIIHPGQPNCHYHGEDDQEDFLVLKGECRLLIEGEERLLKPWDFVHCPKWARHVFVGMGSEPCAILMVGGRTGHGVIYPAIDLAKKYNACPLQETDAPPVSYAGCPKSTEAKGNWQ